MDGHPASSKFDLYEAFVGNIIKLVQSNKELWKETAILVTVDEGGGFYDSGFIQPVDFFGTGPHSNDRRVALLDWRSYQPRL
jgi:phospholipase C